MSFRNESLPFVYHLHLPKTGGSTLGSFLLRNLCSSCTYKTVPYDFYAVSHHRSCLCRQVDAHGTVWRSSSVKSTGILEHPPHFAFSEMHCKKIMTHLNQSFHERRMCKYITTIRDPVSLALSEWSHCRKEFQKDTHKRTCSHYAALRPTVADLSSDAARNQFILSITKKHPNRQTAFLTLNKGDRDHNMSFILERLEKFWLVANTDNLDDLMPCIIRKAQKEGFAIAEQTLTETSRATNGSAARKNQSPSFGGQMLTKSVRQYILRYNAEDAALANHAQKLFQERCM